MEKKESESVSVVDFIAEKLGSESRMHRYYLFEPWDIEERPDWVYEEAIKDGCPLRSPERLELYGDAPKLFQTGYINDHGFAAAIFASNQSGKSYAACVSLLMRLTGEIPICFRYDKGIDTGVKREVTENNIKRFGRRDIRSGEVIDYDTHALPSPLWDCGNVVGFGKYDTSKVAPKGSKSWIVTYKQARDESWWPLLKGMIPERMRDTDRKNGGFDNRHYIAHLSGGAQIHFITYEQGETRLEAAGTLQEEEKLWEVLFDEEPPNNRYWATVTQRVNIIRIVTTPYKGISWTYDDILKESVTNPDITIYHCTKYDCPYYSRKEINVSKRNIKKWEIGARIWGFHTEKSGRPYYEEIYDQICNAQNAFNPHEDKKIFPAFTWDSPFEIATQREDIDMIDCEANTTDCWQMFAAPNIDDAYFVSVDTAEGSEDEGQVQDMSCAQILRMPRENEDWPVQVAVLDSSLPTAEFARLVMYGAAAYNNAMIAWEAVGKSAGTFQSEVDGWPFIYTMVVTNDITKKQTERVGFYTSRKNRTALFDFVGSYMKDNLYAKSLGIKHSKTIKEVAGCVVGKGGRPDHTKRGHNDALMAFGIGLYIFKIAEGQISNNADALVKKQKSNVDPWSRGTAKETRPVLGGRGLDTRKRTRRM